MDIEMVVRALGKIGEFCTANGCNLEDGLKRIDESDEDEEELAQKVATVFVEDAAKQARRAQYLVDFALIVKPHLYANCDTEEINGDNFPGQDLREPVGYRLVPKQLPGRPVGYNYRDARAVADNWVRDGVTAGSASAIDLLRYGAQMREDQPDGFIVCTNGLSMDGRLLYLDRSGEFRSVHLDVARGDSIGYPYVLVREVLPQT